MTRKTDFLFSHRGRLVAVAALAAAGGGGFSLAKLTAASPTPAEANEPKAAQPMSIVLDPARIAASDVGVQAVAPGGLADEVVAPAAITAEPGGQASLTAHAAGAIARIGKRLGDPVRAGEVVALVESREAAEIAAARRAAQAKAELARKAYAREARLYEQKVSARRDMETAQAELAAAEAEAHSAAVAAEAAAVSSDGRYVRVVSPIAGRITAMTASLGAYVQPEAELVRVVDPGRIQVEAQVTAGEAARIRPGQAAMLEMSGGRTRAATVRAVTPALSDETRTAAVVLVPAGAGPTLRPGETLRVRIAAGVGAGAGLVVPEDAVQTLDGREVVFVRTAEGFQARPVVIGQRSAGRVEIAAGLRPGEAVAVRNAFLLKAELRKGGEEDE
jgi:cobalt-zinc-cadmium efflux system membrane fusion protein